MVMADLIEITIPLYAIHQCAACKRPYRYEGVTPMPDCSCVGVAWELAPPKTIPSGGLHWVQSSREWPEWHIVGAPA
jgi:hypothetical protein